MPRYALVVGGVTYDVDFPHEAYACQLAMMEKVIESLSCGKNALLESPTGRHPADPRRCRDDATTRDPDPALERAFDDPLTSSTPLRRDRSRAHIYAPTILIAEGLLLTI